MILSGASEGSVIPIGLGGLLANTTLTEKYNESPEKASRPWDKDASGFVLGEGSSLT